MAVPYQSGFTPAPRNQWYVAAFSHEVSRKPMSRELLGDDVLFYRKEDGTAVALEDRCAHRATALSGGRLVGDTIRCPYHGMQYDSAGTCVHIPSQTSIPSMMRVRSYPLAEKWEWIWIWMGDPALADPSLIPDHSIFRAGDPAMVTDLAFVMQIDCNYQLVHENLLDVSHISFLHEGEIDSGEIARAEAKIQVDGDKITIEREVFETAEGLFAMFFELPNGARVRRILRTEYWAPCLNLVTNIFWQVDDPQAPVQTYFALLPITPKNETSCYHFFAQTKAYGRHLRPEEIDHMHAVVETDKNALECCQRSYDKLGAAAPDVSVRVDAAALRSRRVIADMIAREQQGDVAELRVG